MANHAHPREVLVEIQEMLADGIPQKSVAELMGVSRGTVERVAKGRHGTLHHRSREPQKCLRCLRKVVLPCIACKAEKKLEKSLAAKRAPLKA